jgi:hypothetical protein
MSLFSRARKSAAPTAEAKACAHRDLAPRWASAAAMGNPELITHYQCCSCGAVISREDALKSS